MMEFILVKLQDHYVRIATLLQADFATDAFRIMFRKLPVLKIIF